MLNLALYSVKLKKGEVFLKFRKRMSYFKPMKFPVFSSSHYILLLINDISLILLVTPM